MNTATYTHTPTAPPVVRLRTGRLLAVLVVVALALVGGGFWVLATSGKKVVTAPVESIIQPPWIKDAMAYAPEPAAAAKAAGPTERETVLADQLTALQAGSHGRSGRPWRPSSGRPPQRPPRPRRRHRPRRPRRRRTGPCSISRTP